MPVPFTFSQGVGDYPRDQLDANFAAVDPASPTSFLRSIAYPAGSVGAKLLEHIGLFEGLTTAQIADAIARTALTDDTAAIQAALNQINTTTVGSFELQLPVGTYSLTSAGTRCLQLQLATKLLGSSLEGTRLKVASGSTAIYALDDGGVSGSKIEINNLTLAGNNNASLTSGLRLGRGGVEFGTYGTLDNIMVRDMPNATAFDLDVNVAAVGKLYTINTKDGLVSSAAGTGLHIETFFPLGFSRYGLQQASGDSVNFYEAEAPASDNAIPLMGERGLNVGTFLLAIGTSRRVRTPIALNPTFVLHYLVGATTIYPQDGTSLVGDTTAPDDSGTATSGTIGSLTDTAKTWTLDQWVGAYINITAGTGSGQFIRVQSNNAKTITTDGNLGIAPDGTSVYKISNFIRKTTDGGITFTPGYAHSKTISAYWPAFFRLSVTDSLRAQTVVSGLHAYPDAAPTIASANTIAPTTNVTFISGAVTLKTITAPSPISLGGGQITLIPSAGATWVTDATGNIAIATTSVVGKALILTYDAGTGKWYPSY